MVLESDHRHQTLDSMIASAGKPLGLAYICKIAFIINGAQKVQPQLWRAKAIAAAAVAIYSILLQDYPVTSLVVKLQPRNH